jgi:hypothetical protein
MASPLSGQNLSPFAPAPQLLLESLNKLRAKPFSGLKMPVDPGLTITSKPQEKQSLVKAMGQVPNLPSPIMSVGSGHDEVLFLKVPYSAQESGFKAQIRA